ncbi:hypothetical protein MPLB_130029 [Mesorhizobium sp. ORS 3324]|nr:hypothetical protein MPLB_130029 [Mesorhizobium sp. ORS 3324]
MRFHLQLVATILQPLGWVINVELTKIIICFARFWPAEVLPAQKRLANPARHNGGRRDGGSPPATVIKRPGPGAVLVHLRQLQVRPWRQNFYPTRLCSLISEYNLHKRRLREDRSRLAPALPGWRGLCSGNGRTGS